MCPIEQVPINLLCETRTTSLLQDLLNWTHARLSWFHQNSLSLYPLSVSKNGSSLLVSTAYITENHIYLHIVLDQVPQKQILIKYRCASNLLRRSFQGRLVSLTGKQQQPNKSEISSEICDRSCLAIPHRELWTVGCASDLSSPGSTHESLAQSSPGTSWAFVRIQWLQQPRGILPNICCGYWLTESKSCRKALHKNVKKASDGISSLHYHHLLPKMMAVASWQLLGPSNPLPTLLPEWPLQSTNPGTTLCIKTYNGFPQLLKTKLHIQHLTASHAMPSPSLFSLTLSPVPLHSGQKDLLSVSYTPHTSSCPWLLDLSFSC